MYNMYVLCKIFIICITSWNLPLKPIKIPVFYYKANQHIPHTFIFEQDDTHIWGLPEFEYPGLVKVFKKIFSIIFFLKEWKTPNIVHSKLLDSYRNNFLICYYKFSFFLVGIYL